MKRTNCIEIVGLGSVNVYPIKTEERDFELVNKDLKPLKKVMVEKNKQATYKYVDGEGKDFSKEEIGYNINGRFLQKVERTEKVSKYKLVDKTDIIGNFMSDGYFIVASEDKTTQIHLEKEIGDSKAIEFVYKSSTIGFKWRKSYIMKFQNCFIMVMGVGKIEDGINEFNTQKTAIEQLEDLKEIVVSAKADDIEIAI